MRRFWSVVLFLLATLPISAQDEMPPIISADNVAQLQSVRIVNFDEPTVFDSIQLTDPPEPIEVWQPDYKTGWFALVDNGKGVVLPNADRLNYMSLFYGEYPYYFLWAELPPGATEIIDFDSLGQLSAWVTRVDAGYYVKLEDQLYNLFGYEFEIESNAIPVGIWVDCQSDEWGDCGAWLEVEYVGGDARSEVVRLPYIRETEYQVISYWEYRESDLETIPYAPAQDTEAVVRIGRIPLPYVVTSSETGIVKLWNIQTSDVLYEVDNGTGQPSVFGNINDDATHFVWRDNASETLYLLDFETGENREVAQLNGEYAQWFFLSNDASTILAVNLNFEPIVVAWDVETGEKTVLGEYRQCNRPQPDMARLSRDGTTLVIGCDTGLDVWRVVEAG